MKSKFKVGDIALMAWHGAPRKFRFKVINSSFYGGNEVCLEPIDSAELILINHWLGFHNEMDSAFFKGWDGDHPFLSQDIDSIIEKAIKEALNEE